jgi:hypothetical protein
LQDDHRPLGHSDGLRAQCRKIRTAEFHGIIIKIGRCRNLGGQVEHFQQSASFSLCQSHHKGQDVALDGGSDMAIAWAQALAIWAGGRFKGACVIHGGHHGRNTPRHVDPTFQPKADDRILKTRCCLKIGIKVWCVQVEVASVKERPERAGKIGLFKTGRIAFQTRHDFGTLVLGKDVLH